MVENKKDYFKEFKKRVEAILKCNTSALNKYFWIKLSDKNFHEKVVKKQEEKGVHADAEMERNGLMSSKDALTFIESDV